MGGPCARASLKLAHAQGRMRDFQLRDFCALVDALATLTAGDAAAARAAVDAGLAPRQAGVLGGGRRALPRRRGRARRPGAPPRCLLFLGVGGWVCAGREQVGLCVGLAHS